MFRVYRKHPDVWVGLGYHRLSDGGEQLIKARWVLHDAFDSRTFDNDIALLALDEEAVLSDKVQAIAPARANSDVEPGTDLLISGWGSLLYGKPCFYPLCRHHTTLRRNQLVCLITRPQNSGFSNLWPI